MAGRFTGQRIERREDDRLLRGRGAFVGGSRRVGMVHAAFVRSPFAHARIRGIDTSAARELPGVVAVLTGDDGDSTTVPVTFQVPKRAHGRTGRLSMTGGSWSYFYPEDGLDSVADLEKMLAKSPRNDAVEAGLTLFGRRDIERRIVTDPTSRVVWGGLSVPVTVRR